MALSILMGIVFYDVVVDFLNQPALYDHARFVHIVSVTLFFANAIIGMIWEFRSLSGGNKDVILHTYKTVSWLDARLSSPLILLAVFSGLMLGFTTGDFWSVGWLSVSFVLFILSGVFWVLSDIPTQYRVRSLTEQLSPDAASISPELMKLLKLRWLISLTGVLPLAIVFVLMIYKPDIMPVSQWFSGRL
ncbi:DUF2269 family protein [Spirochaeta dissipatitropha]